VAFVVWAEPAVAMLESAAAAVGGPGVLLVPMGTGIVAGWCGASSLDPGKADEPVNVAIGTRGDGIDGFRRSHSEALEARRVARLAGMRGRVRYEDVALPALLTSDIEQARAFAARELQDLAADGETERRLSETVLAVLEAQGSPRRAGQRLGIHENTVAKRLRAAENLLGRGIDERPSELLAALIVRQIVNA
jgi:DNA-binding PucR family transcriptional regulator